VLDAFFLFGGDFQWRLFFSPMKHAELEKKKTMPPRWTMLFSLSQDENINLNFSDVQLAGDWLLLDADSWFQPLGKVSVSACTSCPY
jgi:hypothetical protein